jgi:hypothetical protein
MAVAFARRFFNWPIQNVADLDRPVVARAEQVQRGHSRKRTHFMIYLRPTIRKESLDCIQRACAQFLEYTEAESLSDGRTDAIEDRVRSRALHPLGAAVGEKPAPGRRELNARAPLGAL